MKKRNIIAVLMSCILIAATSVPAFAQGQVSGGWSVTEDTAITEDAQEAFDSVTEKLMGVSYTPVALLGTQVVAGTNYCILCRSQVVYPSAVPQYVLMYIYKDLQGNAELLEIQDLELGISPADDGEEEASETIGGMETETE